MNQTFTAVVPWCCTLIACLAGQVFAAVPHVTKSVPEAEAKEIDPKTREVRVIYDQAMDTSGYSVLNNGSLGPKILGRPRWTDNRTLTVRVQLEPDHRYALVFNDGQQFNNIVNSNGQPAEPYVMFFSTAPLPGHKSVGQPHVVKTVPSNGGKNIDPATHELRITFDQPMDTEGRSLVGGGPNFPDITGDDVKWEDGDRTIIFPVKLQPNHTYQCSANSKTFTGFMSKRGFSAVPYPFSFKTASAAAGRAAGGEAPDVAAHNLASPNDDAAAPLTLDQNRESIEILKEAIDQDYSYRDRTHVDWAKQFARYTPEMEKASTPLDFAKVVAKLLEPADDLHLSVEAEGQVIYPWNGKVPPANFSISELQRIVPGWAEHGSLVATGAFPAGPQYVLIRLWDPGNADDLDAAYEVIRHADPNRGLIIDVRPNGGGDEPMAQTFAGRFVDTPRVYGKNETRFGGKFDGPYERVLEPNTNSPDYRGKIAVLMGPRCVSSNESFLLMMKTVPGCKLIGAHSRGASGNPKPEALANDVVVNLSSWRDMLPDGTCIEGIGIAPDIEVRTTPADFADRDPVLDAALAYLAAKPDKE